MGKGKGVLRVVNKRGDIREYFGPWWNPAKQDGFNYNPNAYDPSSGDVRPYSAILVRKTLEEKMKNINNILMSGDLMFVFESGHLRVSRSNKQWKNIVHIVEILKSNASPTLKANGIYPLLVRESERINDKTKRIRTWDWKEVKNLVRNFKGHPQLDERIAALKKKYKIPNWKQPPERQEPKVPENLKNDPRLTPEGAIKNALRLLKAKRYQEYINNCRPPLRDRKLTVKMFDKNNHPRRLIIAFRNVQNKNPVIDDVDSIGYFLIDAPEFEDEPLGTYFNKLPIRKVGHLWLIGY